MKAKCEICERNPGVFVSGASLSQRYRGALTVKVQNTVKDKSDMAPYTGDRGIMHTLTYNKVDYLIEVLSA